MAYVSASCLSDRWRASEKGWAAFATLPNPGKVAKDKCPREGPCGQQRRHVEVCQLSWKWMLTTLLEIERKKLVKVFDIGGELTRVRVGYGFTIADLMQHWKYLGELMGTCPLCRVRKGCMCQPLKAPIKTAEDEARRLIAAVGGEWPGYHNWGKKTNRKPKRLFDRNAAGKMVVAKGVSKADYERAKKATGQQLVAKVAHDLLPRDANQLVCTPVCMSYGCRMTAV